MLIYQVHPFVDLFYPASGKNRLNVFLVQHFLVKNSNPLIIHIQSYRIDPYIHKLLHNINTLLLDLHDHNQDLLIRHKP